MNDIDLVNAAINQGDREGWRLIYYSYCNAIKRYLSAHYFISEHIIDDLTQQVFIKILTTESKPFFKDVVPFKVWLIEIAKNVARDYLKSRPANNENETDYLEDIDRLQVELPQVTLIDDRQKKKCEDALNQLSERDRKLVQLRINGTDYKTIAKELNIREDSARTFYKRAIEKLKQTFLNGEKGTVK